MLAIFTFFHCYGPYNKEGRIKSNNWEKAYPGLQFWRCDFVHIVSVAKTDNSWPELVRTIWVQLIAKFFFNREFLRHDLCTSLQWTAVNSTGMISLSHLWCDRLLNEWPIFVHPIWDGRPMEKNDNIEVFKMNQNDPTKTCGFLKVMFCVFRWIVPFRTGGWVKNG